MLQAQPANKRDKQLWGREWGHTAFIRFNKRPGPALIKFMTLKVGAYSRWALIRD